MNDKEYNKIKSRIGKYMTKWQGPMGMRWYKINVVWDRSYDRDGASARTDMSRWQYHECDITFFLPTLADRSDEEIESVVVHELTHCLLAAISCNMKGVDENDDYRRQIMEQNTTMVANALEWVY